MKRFILMALLPALAGCAELPGYFAPAGSAAPAAVAPPPEPEAQPAPAPSGVLGRTTASLGAAAEGGMWLSTPLVSAEVPGRVRAIQTGQSVAVTLRPARSGGARLSLEAMQALGLPLTALAEVEVSAEG